MRIDVIDLSMDDDDDLGRLAKMLFGREETDVIDAIGAILSRRDPNRTIRVIQRIINTPEFHAVVKPVTERTLVELPEDAVYLGSQGTKDDDRHIHLLVKHPKEDNWTLHVICPRSRTANTTATFTGDQQLAVYKANIFLDIAYGHLKPEPLVDQIVKKWKDESAAKNE
jgi:hypothetical protein